MAIFIHPTLQRQPCALERLRRETGMTDVVTKHSVKLVNKKPAPIVEPRPARIVESVILECTHCSHKSNMLLRGETCTRCKKGQMFDPWNGGSAA
jgi:hypothetical protein